MIKFLSHKKTLYLSGSFPFLLPFVILFLSYGLSGCQSPKEDFNIEEKKIVKVIADIHIAEVALQSVSVSLKDSMAQVYYNQVFEMHGVTEEDFYHDLNLIKAQPKEVKLFYTKVLENLNKSQQKLVEDKKEE